MYQSSNQPQQHPPRAAESRPKVKPLYGVRPCFTWILHDRLYIAPTVAGHALAPSESSARTVSIYCKSGAYFVAHQRSRERHTRANIHSCTHTRAQTYLDGLHETRTLEHGMAVGLADRMRLQNRPNSKLGHSPYTSMPQQEYISLRKHQYKIQIGPWVLSNQTDCRSQGPRASSWPHMQEGGTTTALVHMRAFLPTASGLPVACNRTTQCQTAACNPTLHCQAAATVIALLPSDVGIT